MKALDSRWTQNKPNPEARKDFEIIVRNSTLLLTRLKEIIEERERELNSKAFTEKDFEDPNWSHKHSYRIGRLGELKAFKDLIPF